MKCTQLFGTVTWTVQADPYLYDKRKSDRQRGMTHSFTDDQNDPGSSFFSF
jgi:hypothetical protein